MGPTGIPDRVTYSWYDNGDNDYDHSGQVVADGSEQSRAANETTVTYVRASEPMPGVANPTAPPSSSEAMPTAPPLRIPKKYVPPSEPVAVSSAGPAEHAQVVAAGQTRLATIHHRMPSFPRPGAELAWAREELKRVREEFGRAREEMALAREEVALAREEMALARKRISEQMARTSEQLARTSEQMARTSSSLNVVMDVLGLLDYAPTGLTPTSAPPSAPAAAPTSTLIPRREVQFLADQTAIASVPGAAKAPTFSFLPASTQHTSTSAPLNNPGKKRVLSPVPVRQLPPLSAPPKNTTHTPFSLIAGHQAAGSLPVRISESPPWQTPAGDQPSFQAPVRATAIRDEDEADTVNGPDQPGGKRPATEQHTSTTAPKRRRRGRQ